MAQKKQEPTEYFVAGAQAQAALSIASDLGIEATTADVRGAGGAELVSLVLSTGHHPFIQGAFLGYLVSRGIIIETVVGGFSIRIKDPKALKQYLKRWLDT